MLPHGNTASAYRLIGQCQRICHDQLACQAPVSAEAGTEFPHLFPAQLISNPTLQSSSVSRLFNLSVSLIFPYLCHFVSFCVILCHFVLLLSSIFQDDVASRARARELAVSLVNRARAQIGAGDPVKAEQARRRCGTPWNNAFVASQRTLRYLEIP